MPIFRDCLSIGIQDCDLTGPPYIMDARNDDLERSLSRCLQYPKGRSSERRRTPIEFRQLPPGSPAPFFFPSIGVADQRGRVRLLVSRGIKEKNARMAFALQVPKPDTCP